MTIRKISSDAIESGSITESLLHINVSNKVNAAYATANTANSAGSGGYDQANNAYAQANAAYGKANAAVTVAENAYAQANTARTTANDAYGAANTKLSTSGGSISGDVSITGNLTVTGNATTMNVSNLSVNDSIILLSTNAVGDSNDIGFVGHFDRGATATHAGLIRKATQNQFYLFDNYEVEPTNNVIDVAGNNFTVGNLRLGIINANSFVTAAGMDVTGQANAAYGQANAAYGAANNRVLKAGDTMTGQLNISAGGLLVTGNVGVGTATPSTLFNIYGGTSGNKTDLLAISHPADAGAQPVLRFDTIPVNNNVLGRISVKDAGSFAGDMIFEVAPSRGAANTATTERMVIKGDGSVGIGTTNPGEKLEVRGNLRIGDSDNANYIVFKGTTGDSPQGFNHTYIGERIYGGTESSELLIFKGNDGPTAAGPDRIRLVAAEIRFDTYGVDDAGSTFGSFNAVANSPATNKMILTSAGSVGIGTTNPSQRLHVFGGTALVQSSSGEVQLRVQSGTGKSYGLLNNPGWAADTLMIYDFTADAHRLAITSGGNVGIGTTDPGYRLDVNGVVAARNGGVDGTYNDAFVARYSSNLNERNIIQSAVSSAGAQSGFRFRVSDGAGSAGTTSVLDLNRDMARFTTNVRFNGSFRYDRKGYTLANSYDWHWLARRYSGYASDVRANINAYFWTTVDQPVDEQFLHTDDLNNINYIGENIWGDVHQYRAWAITYIYVSRSFTVSNVTLNGDDPYSLWIDGAYVTGSDSCCAGVTYSYTFSPGWRRIEMIYSESGGGHYVSLGWNPKNYTTNIKAMTPFGPARSYG